MQAADFYFARFEDRVPPAPLPRSTVVELISQTLAAASLIAGAIYIWWRWTHSINFDALWFAIPMVVAETCAYFGLILFMTPPDHLVAAKGLMKHEPAQDAAAEPVEAERR